MRDLLKKSPRRCARRRGRRAILLSRQEIYRRLCRRSRRHRYAGVHRRHRRARRAGPRENLRWPGISGHSTRPARNQSNAAANFIHRQPRESARDRNQRRPDDRPARSRRSWLDLTAKLPEDAMFIFDPNLSPPSSHRRRHRIEAEPARPRASLARSARQNAPLLAGGELPDRRSNLSCRRIRCSANRSLKEHIKPRLLGHWGTSTGLSFIYVHLNRLIKESRLSVLYIAGPGHGGPALNANSYLEGTYSAVHPGNHAGYCGHPALLSRILHSRRRAQPLRPAFAQFHSRRRRTRLCAAARLRSRVR